MRLTFRHTRTHTHTKKRKGKKAQFNLCCINILSYLEGSGSYEKSQGTFPSFIVQKLFLILKLILSKIHVLTLVMQYLDQESRGEETSFYLYHGSSS